MAITALATENTTIGPAQYADMTSVLTARFKVDGPGDLAPSTASGRTVRIAPGGAFAAGTRVRSSATESVVLDSQIIGARFDAIVLRIDWSNPNPVFVAVKGDASSIPVNTTSSFDPAKVNRIPGVVYDALIATVHVSGVSTLSNLTDYRMWGGDGGPYRVTDGALSSPGMLDARRGTWIATDQSAFTKRLDDDGVWRDVGTPANPWREWTPVLRYYGTDPVNGRTGGTPVALGTGGQYSGKYRIVDGVLEGFVSITTAAGNHFGTGAITYDLPMPCADWQPDVWNNGHIYMSKGTNGADRNLDWQVQALIKAGWSRAMIFAPHSSDFGAMEAHRASSNGQSNTGIPVIVGGWSVGDVYTFSVTYPVAN